MKHGTRLSFLLALVLTCAQNACAVQAAPASSKAGATTDGGAKTGTRKPNDPATKATHAPPDAGTRTARSVHTDGDGETADTSDSVIGLTRAQLRVRRGPPTEVHGSDWIYTPDQPGCRDVIVSEVMTFKRNVVATVRLQRRQTGKVCRSQFE